MRLIPLLAAAALLSAAPQDDRNKELQRRIDGLCRKVEETLGLKFKGQIPAAHQTAEDFRKFLMASIEKELPREKAEAMGLYYKLLGLVPDDFDFVDTAIDLVASQAGAYYDPDQKKIFVLMGGMPANVMDGMLFHELVHALQDQEHDLGTAMRKLDEAGNSDRATAYKFLVEGEASYWMQLYMVDEMGAGSNPQLRTMAINMAMNMVKNTTTKKIIGMMQMQAGVSEEMAKAAESIKDAPPILIRTLVDPYMRGMYAVHKLVKEKGKDELRGMFGDRKPSCTRDLMYGDDWMKSPRGVTAVELADLGAALGEGWKQAYADTAGAITFHTMFEDQVKTADAVARNWNGDRFEVWRNGDEALIAGVADFETEEAATAFARQVERKYRESWTGGKEIEELEGEGTRLSAQGDRLLLQQRGTSVALARGSAAKPDALLSALWKSRIKDPAALRREF